MYSLCVQINKLFTSLTAGFCFELFTPSPYLLRAGSSQTRKVGVCAGSQKAVTFKWQVFLTHGFKAGFCSFVFVEITSVFEQQASTLKFN
jgi:hypothetical protein